MAPGGTIMAVLQHNLNACRLLACLRRHFPKTAAGKKAAILIAANYEKIIHPILYGVKVR
ncbi:MAG TPA: hypothetical protein PKO34_00930 [Smithellaceae bacterium]|nr:MAG: hypothetical protein BWY15_02297 [Firmicutes bacterium ADurb.Bin193]HNS55589.1 hypothetical protein [Smithellaceae bacterium]